MSAATTLPPADSATSPALGRGRGGYIGAFDGIRGIALVAVLLYHGGYSEVPGGFFSVATFFTLSGFLITTLMLQEIGTTDRLSLKAFWRRRARRLLPAALFTLLAVLLLRGYFTATGPERLRGDVLAALFYVENWWLIHTHQAYGALFAAGSPVQHFWSLAIEEQYYLVFPLVMVVLHRFVRRRWIVASILGGLFVLTSLQAARLSSDLTRTYYGTDTRAPEILFGILLAYGVATWDRERSDRTRHVIDLLAVFAFVGMGYLWLNTELHDSYVFRGGMFVNSALTSVLIIAGLQRGAMASFLSFAPWRRLGSISYGVYLVHWPIFLILNPVRLDLGRNATFAVRIAVTLAVAIGMYVLFENPIRHNRMLRGRPFYWVVGAGTAAIVLIAVTMPNSASGIVDLQTSSPVSGQIAALRSAKHVPGDQRVLVVGDSMSWSVWVGLDEWGRRHHVQFGRYSALGCGVGGPGTIDYLGLKRKTFPDCAQWKREMRTAVRTFRPDTVLVVVGLADISPRKFPDGEFRSIGDPAYDARLTRKIDQMARTLTSTGAALRWVTFPHVDIPYNAGGTGLPPFVENDPARIEELNVLVARALAGVPGAEMIDLAKYMRDRPGGELDPAFRPDGAHLSADGTAEVARWLGPQLAPQ